MSVVAIGRTPEPTAGCLCGCDDPADPAVRADRLLSAFSAAFRDLVTDGVYADALPAIEQLRLAIPDGDAVENATGEKP